MDGHQDNPGNPSTGQEGPAEGGKSDLRGYLRLAAMIGASALAMYVVMYFNTYSIDHVYFSWTRLFMTMMSAAVMAVIMLAFMRQMYRNRSINIAVVLMSVVLFGSGLWLARSQTTVGDVAWMEAMIPHHSIAILTSKNANISDPQVKELANSIITAQEAEIAEMKTLIDKLQR